MNIVLKAASVEMLLKAMVRNDGSATFLTRLERAMTQGTTEITIALDLLNDAGIANLESTAQQAGDRSVTMQTSVYRRMLVSPGTVKITRLNHLEAAIVNWLLENVNKGWLFEIEDDEILPWTVTDIRYESGRQGYDSFVRMSLDANRSKGPKENSHKATSFLSFDQSLLPATVEELMANQRMFHETDELHQRHLSDIKRFEEITAQANEQFIMVPGNYQSAAKDYRPKVTINAPRRCVNDETLLKRHIRTEANRSSWNDRGAGGRQTRPSADREIPETAFTDLPTHPVHMVYDLEGHQPLWAHTIRLTDYEYATSSTDSIVLRDEHRELIDILTADQELLADEDVVAHKQGGRNVLTIGPPGVGKTLLAQTYSERMKRPLYSVHAGQLGMTAESVGRALDEIFINAQRWSAIVNIDEAETYIRQRGNDIDQNAIVAQFLIKLETTGNQMTFMSSNREGEIDDAIESRCIAIVRFGLPDDNGAKMIWRIQARQQQLDIDDATIDAIVAHHGRDGGKRASGRDIRNLLRLGARYHAANKRRIDADLLIALGAFKGL